jgi:hypothetical protein
MHCPSALVLWWNSQAYSKILLEAILCSAVLNIKHETIKRQTNKYHAYASTYTKYVYSAIR